MCDKTDSKPKRLKKTQQGGRVVRKDYFVVLTYCFI